MSDDRERMREAARAGIRDGAAACGFSEQPAPLIVSPGIAAWMRSIGLVEGVEFVEIMPTHRRPVTK